MEDYNKVLDATEVAENANGVAAEKMTVYNESLAAAQNRLTASIQQFAQDSNLDQILAQAYDLLSKIVDILNLLINKSGILSPIIKAVGVALATAFTGATISNMVKSSETLSAMASAAPNVINAFKNMATGAANFGAVLNALGGWTTVVIAALGALLVIVPKIVDAFNNLKNAKENALKQSTQDLENANKNLEETNSQIKDIQDKITEINNKDSLTLTDQAEKERLEEQLDTLKEIQKVQQEIAQEKAEEQAQKTRDVVKSKYSDSINDDETYSLLATSGETRDLSDTVYKAESASAKELAANIKYLEEQKKNLNGTEEDYAERLSEINSLESESKSKLLEKKQELLGYKQTLIDAGDTSSEEYQTIVDRINEITVALDPSKFPKVSLGEMIDTSGMEEKIKMVVETGSEAGKEVATRYAEEFAKEIEANPTDLQAWKDVLNIPDSQELGVDQLTQEILALFYQMYGSISSESDVATESIYSQKSALEMYQDAVQQVHDNTTDLTSAYQDMIDKGYISETVVKKLTAAHPELVKELKLENGQYKVNIQTLKDAYTAEVNQAQGSIKAQKTSAEATLKAIDEKMDAYQREAEVLAGMADDSSAKAKLIGVQHSIDMWKTQRNTIQANIDGIDSYIDELNKLKNWSPPSTKSSSSKSTTDKAAKEFENSVKEKIKNLKGVVTAYSTNGFGAWDSQEAIDAATTEYNKFLSEIVNNPAARKIAAEQLGISIDGKTEAQQIQMITGALQEQASTISEAHQKLIKADLDAKDKELKALAEIEKEEKEQYDKALEYIEDLEEATVNMIETGIGLLEKAGDFVFNLLGKISDRYDKQLDNLDKISDELDKQKDAFEDKIDAQKELLKLQKEEKDNADELAEKNKSIADIDAQLMELQYDDSAEAQAKRLQLLDERAEKEKDLADWQNEYDYNTKIDALDKEKAEYEKTIEAEKKALEAQKETIQEAQKSFEDTLSKIQSGFNSFIKILSSDVVKNLLGKALISYGGDTYKNLMYGWNKAFGDGMDATMDNLFANFEKVGAKSGTWIGDLQNKLTSASNLKQRNIDLISQAQSGISVEKNQLEAGNIDLTKSFTSSIDVKSIKDQLSQANQAFANFKVSTTKIISDFGSDTKNIVKNVGKSITSFANGISGSSRPGINSAKKTFNGLNKSLKDIFNLDWNGINGGMASGLKSVSKTIDALFTPIMNGAASIGDAISAGITGFFPGIFQALATLVSTTGTALQGVLSSIAAAWSSIPVVGWAIAAAAAAGAVALGVAIAKIVGKTRNSKVSQPTQSFTAKKHHNGADYVKKENPALDKMLGLGDDETVSILKVGEAVVPTWANAATSSGNSSSYTGSPFGNAVDSAVKSARANTQTSYNTGSSSISISMPINIQGDADATTVKALKQEADNIVNKVLKTINNQTRLGGYRNIKAATI